VLPLRMKSPAQPLVFCFSDVSELMGAVEKLFEIDCGIKARLCLNRDRYFLAVYSSLSKRSKFFCVVSEYGKYLGPGSVLYSFFEEHGKKISDDAVNELGSAIHRV